MLNRLILSVLGTIAGECSPDRALQSALSLCKKPRIGAISLAVAVNWCPTTPAATIAFEGSYSSVQGTTIPSYSGPNGDDKLLGLEWSAKIYFDYSIGIVNWGGDHVLAEWNVIGQALGGPNVGGGGEVRYTHTASIAPSVDFLRGTSYASSHSGYLEASGRIDNTTGFDSSAFLKSMVGDEAFFPLMIGLGANVSTDPDFANVGYHRVIWNHSAYVELQVLWLERPIPDIHPETPHRTPDSGSSAALVVFSLGALGFFRRKYV